MFQVCHINAIAQPTKAQELLGEGWEPFAVSGDYLWLRREDQLRKVEEPRDWLIGWEPNMTKEQALRWVREHPHCRAFQFSQGVR